MKKFERIGLEYISVNFKEQLKKNNFKEQLYLFEQAPRNGLIKENLERLSRKLFLAMLKFRDLLPTSEVYSESCRASKIKFFLRKCLNVWQGSECTSVLWCKLDKSSFLGVSRLTFTSAGHNQLGRKNEMLKTISKRFEVGKGNNYLTVSQKLDQKWQLRFLKQNYPQCQ